MRRIKPVRVQVRVGILSCLTLTALTLISGLSSAKEVVLDAVPLQGKKVHLDGMLKEWPALAPLTERTAAAHADSLSAEGMVGYDDEKLYVAMRVRDPHLLRSKSFGRREDRATLWLSFPRAGGGRQKYEISLFPGVAGSSDGAVKLGSTTVRGASIVEYPDAEGVTFEAAIPWSSFDEAKRVRSGLRGALQYFDGDTSIQLSTARFNGNELPALTIESEFALRQDLAAKGVRLNPGLEAVGNLVGDAMLEQVAVFDRYLTVTGWHYRAGTEFFYQDLQVASAKDVKRLSLTDVTGDGLDDVLIERRVKDGAVTRQYFEVWQFRDESKAPQLIFQHEMGVEVGDAHIVDLVSTKRAGHALDLVISQGDAKDDRVDPNTWDTELRAGDTVPLLLPWQSIESRRYHFAGREFVVAEEKEGKARLAAPKRGTRLWSGPNPGNPAAATPSGKAAAQAGAVAVVPPVSGDTSERVYELYRTEHGAKNGKPKFDGAFDVAGDETPERVVIHGKDLVVFGKKFRAGTSYAYTTLGFERESDITKVETRDLTADGKAEVLVHGVLHAKASKQLGGETVTRHALFVYSVTPTGIARIFAAETGRSLGERDIVEELRFTAKQIELQPGRAQGWTKATYPFPEDRGPYGGLEPLLLPWSETRSKRYRFSDGQFRLAE